MISFIRYAFIAILAFSQTIQAQPIIELEQVSQQGIGPIVGIHHAGDDRIFLLLQTGVIRILTSDGDLEPAPFLDIRNKVQTGGERGLLGLAFHPNYAENGQFFLNYTRPGLESVISRWQVSDSDPNLADPDSEEVLITVSQPFNNHNGGDIRFGPDGHLYIGLGDGGSGGDPQDIGQDSLSLLGKILRINVDGDSGYTIPSDNPFVGNPDVLDEIWALGLRNPWRFSFDALTGDLWIADVGQNALEEINKAPADSQGGENYGWRCYEGTELFNNNGCQSEDSYTFPIFEYNHNQGDRSITGGFVYRGDDFPAMQGIYFYADFVSSRYFRLDEVDDGFTSSIINTSGFAVGGPSTFGVDYRGELYAASYFNGVIFRIKDFCQAYAITLSEQDDQSLILNLESVEWSDDFTIEWFQDGNLIENETDSILFLQSEGHYSATLTHERGCIMNSDTIEVILSSREDIFNQTQIKVWPNPFNQALNIQNESLGDYTTRLLDIHGKILLNQSLPALTYLSWFMPYPPGVYILQIKDESGRVYNTRVVKQ